MPLAVESIQPDESVGSVRRKIAESMKKLIDEENKDPKAAAGQVYGTAEQKWGKSVPKGG